MRLAGGRLVRTSAGWVLAGLLLVVATPAPRALAAAEGVAFSPAITEVAVPLDQQQVAFQVDLRNKTAQPQSFKISLVDFGSLDEQGGVAFLGEAASELEHKYGLAAWMKVDHDQVDLAAGGEVTLNVTIENRPTLASGGHYGAVLATNMNSSSGDDNDPRVGVKQVLSSLVLATKGDGADASLELVSQSANGGWWHLPTHVNYRFQNTGTVHVVPRGVTEVRDMAGRVVARGALNEESATILPGSYRRYSSPLALMSKAWMPGSYSITTTYRFDGTTQTKQLVTHFWYAGSIGVLVILLLTLAVMAGFVWWLMQRGRRAKT